MLAGASFEAARKYDGRGAHRHCEVERVRLSCTSTLNRSNPLEVGNCAKKDLGKGEEVLRGEGAGEMSLPRRSRVKVCFVRVFCIGFASQ